MSVVPSPDHEGFVRAGAPAGCALVVAEDVDALVGSVDDDSTAETVGLWAAAASARGLWHDWLLSAGSDVRAAETFMEMLTIDQSEACNPGSPRYFVMSETSLDTNAIRLAVDVTWLGPYQTGAQVLTTAAIEALATNPRISEIQLFGLNELPQYAEHLGQIDKVNVGLSDSRVDVLWYPNQIDQRVEISAAREVAQRVVTTYLDLIAYDISRYHGSEEAWSAYRSLQRRVALSVDGITTISADVAARLRLEVPHIDDRRIRPIPLGLDHINNAPVDPDDGRPDGLPDGLLDRPFVLVLGNDFQHKNRDFAIKVWEELLARGVNCDLVLVGLHVKSSSSIESERELLGQHTNLRGSAFTLGHVPDATRVWLMTHAAAVLYPSSAEGFGFVPYEAAAMGTPSTFTAFGPLAEISGVTDVPRSWEVGEYADDLAALLDDPEFARKRVDGLRSVASQATWSRFADQLVEFFVEIRQLPPIETALAGISPAEAAALSSILSSRTWRATEPLRRWGKRVRSKGR
ncbi:glycosyltransferase [Candidatus Nanopelagicales bacterium]|nr:glycosyltransferase [Candidatus Nanopelagicales bacterium]